MVGLDSTGRVPHGGTRLGGFCMVGLDWRVLHGGT